MGTGQFTMTHHQLQQDQTISIKITLLIDFFSFFFLGSVRLLNDHQIKSNRISLKQEWHVKDHLDLWPFVSFKKVFSITKIRTLVASTRETRLLIPVIKISCIFSAHLCLWFTSGQEPWNNFAKAYSLEQ